MYLQDGGVCIGTGTLTVLVCRGNTILTRDKLSHVCNVYLQQVEWPITVPSFPYRDCCFLEDRVPFAPAPASPPCLPSWSAPV